MPPLRPRDWELRDPTRRFQEIGTADEFEEEEEESGSDDGYDDGRAGVLVDPNARGFVSDELHFDGYDLGRMRRSRRSMYDEDYDPEELKLLNQQGGRFQRAVRDKEEALLQSALARIARARAKGKTNVNLSQGEIEALERSTAQQQEPSTSRELALVSAPANSAKSSKNKASRSNSSTNLAGQKTRKRGGSGFFGSGASSPKSNSKAKVSRKASAEQTLPSSSSAQNTQGIMVPGPNGVPVYAPISYYNNQGASTDLRRTTSRSTSRQRRRDSSPPQRTSDQQQYAYPQRYYNMRPESSSSNRSLPDDIDWQPPGSLRNRHQSPYTAYAPPLSNQYHASSSTEYDPASPPLPLSAQQQQQLNRRIVSGPPDVRYSTQPYSRRSAVPLSSSPLAAGQRPLPPQASLSDPAVVSRRPVPGGDRRSAGLVGRGRGGRESSPSSESEEEDDDDDDDDDDGEGVQVEVLPDAGNALGYAVRSSAATAGGAASTGVGASGARGGERKRKGKR